MKNIMQNLSAKILVLALLLALSGAAQAAQTASSAAASGAHILVTVNGLVCDFCAVSVKKTFMKKSAVEKVDVNLTTKLVTIDLKPGQTLADADIKKGITDAGYDVVSIRRD